MISTEIKLPFALSKDGVLVHIADVENGKKTFFICPSCRFSLVAVKGSRRQHHFRHDVDDACENGLESAIHLAAKQEIVKRKQITLPKSIIETSAHDSRGGLHREQKILTNEGEVIYFDQVEQEKDLHQIRADVLATKDKDSLIIEIFYRHKVDDLKRDKIVRANISAIEIDLSDLLPEDVKDWQSFWSSMNEPSRIKWLHDAKIEDEKQKFENEMRLKIQTLNERHEHEKNIRKEVERKDEIRRSRAFDFHNRFR